MLDFPRDLWVNISYIASHLNGQDHEKLNQAYLYGNPGDGFHYWDDPSAGPGLLALTLNVNFGVNVNHYIAVNMKTFVKMVDAVGGLDITFKEPVALSHDPNLQAGLHHSMERKRWRSHAIVWMAFSRAATIRTSSYAPCNKNSRARELSQISLN